MIASSLFKKLFRFLLVTSGLLLAMGGINWVNSAFTAESEITVGQVDIEATSTSVTAEELWLPGENKILNFSVKNSGSAPIVLNGKLAGQFLLPELEVATTVAVEKLTVSFDQGLNWQTVPVKADENNTLGQFYLPLEQKLEPDNQAKFQLELKLVESIPANYQLQTFQLVVQLAAQQIQQPREISSLKNFPLIQSILSNQVSAWFKDQAELTFEWQTGDWLPPKTQLLCQDSEKTDCIIAELITNGSFATDLTGWQVQAGQLSRLTEADSSLPGGYRAAVQLEFEPAATTQTNQATLNQLIEANHSESSQLGFWFRLVSEEDLSGFDLPTLTVSLGKEIIYQAQAAADSWQAGVASLPSFDQPTELKFTLHNTGDQQKTPKLLLTGVTTEVFLLTNPQQSLKFETDESETQTHLLYQSAENLPLQQTFFIEEQAFSLANNLKTQLVNFWSTDRFAHTEAAQDFLLLSSLTSPAKPVILSLKRSMAGDLALLFSIGEGDKALNIVDLELQASLKALTVSADQNQLSHLDYQLVTPFIDDSQLVAAFKQPLVLLAHNQTNEEWFRLRVKDNFGRWSEFSPAFFSPSDSISKSEEK